MTEQLLQKLSGEINLSYEEYRELIEYRELVTKEYESIGFDKPYAQGSLRLGTIIKSYSKTDDSFFDVDLVAEKKSKETNAQQFKQDALTIIKGVTPENKKPCWAFNLDPKFHVDVVPAKPVPINNNLSWSELAIDVTKHDGHEQNYKWESSNPKGYYYWFRDINRRVFGSLYENLSQPIIGYTLTDRQLKRMVRTNLQKAIQVTKWLNSKYFTGLPSEKHKPISIILTTLITGIFDLYDYNNTSNLSIEEILKDFIYVMKDIQKNKSEFLLESAHFSKRNVVKTIKAMYKNDSKWYVPNPTNSAENFAAKWNDPIDGSEKVDAFFEFINHLDELLNNSSDLMRATKKPNRQDVPIGNKPYYGGDLWK